MGIRRQGREFALQAIYLKDISKISSKKALKSVTMGAKIDKKVLEFATLLTSGIDRNTSKLDKLIVKYTENWDLDRMAALDRNILRMGTYEFLHEGAAPHGTRSLRSSLNPDPG